MKVQRILIVSNRLPVSVSRRGGQYSFEESGGGLVSGLKTYLQSKLGAEKNFEYLWIGWPGTAVEEKSRAEIIEKLNRESRCHPVFLTERTAEKFYYGFCNETIWPLFHYFPSYVNYDENYWAYYKRVNELFRDAILEILRPGDLIWVHDYHLMLLPKLLRDKQPEVPLGFFLHIPFPNYEMFRLLPRKWQRSIVDGLLGADLVGFHTYDYTQDFLRSAARVFGYEHTMGEINLPDHTVRAEAFPMGIDFETYAGVYDNPEVLKELEKLKRKLQGMKVILSIDRLDYTKGILNRLHGYELFLKENPEWHKKIVLILSVVPSRDRVGKYEEIKTKIDEIVGRLNGKLGSVNWTPVLYQYKSLPFTQLLAHYLVSDVALVTPLRDGMNLVAKEYVAAHTRDQKGVLILSEMTGAAKELGEALLINPNSIRDIADSIKEAFLMPEEEQKYRLDLMQRRLKRYSIGKWATEFLNTLKNLKVKQLERTTNHKNTTALKDSLFKKFLSARKRILFLDYDGTLVTFASAPHLAKPSEKLLSTLGKLTANPKNEVVLISGRDRATLARWFGNLNLNLIAEHGAWIKKRQTDWQLLNEQETQWKERIYPILDAYSDRLPGAFVEEKEFSLVWHFRAAYPELGESRAKELIEELTALTAKENLDVLRGNKVIEIRNKNINKGLAAKKLLDKEKYDYILAIGDDRTDEDLFKSLPKGAHAIKVGKASAHAELIFPQVAHVLQFLEQLTETQ
ncbi:bifunctional alpha,alpha-trehalose-phosphate synthase (UDP-forming)/trehalose-phosphatase [Candidatus Uhrbacteria bacterium]|nr:bifunctional alpha,alpha-trehalose-phosphate synthase (UDP-forming)/trehalose-phosphatase [Candidatus Uhrbacteria bacterium]